MYYNVKIWLFVMFTDELPVDIYICPSVPAMNKSNGVQC